GRFLSDLLHGGERAENPGLDCKKGIELAAEGLQSDDRSELHQLFLAKMPLEPVEETNRDPPVGVSHPLPKLSSQFFAQGEERALTVIAQSGRHLLFRCAVSHPTGCVDVNSIRTAVDARGFHAEKMSEVATNQSRRHDSRLKGLHALLNRRPEAVNF